MRLGGLDKSGNFVGGRSRYVMFCIGDKDYIEEIGIGIDCKFSVVCRMDIVNFDEWFGFRNDF